MPGLMVLREMLDYRCWLRDRVLDRLEAVSPDVYLGDAALVHGSIRRTRLHHLRSEHNWRCRIQGLPLHELEAESLAGLRDAWKVEEASWRALIGSLSEADLTRPVRYRLSV